LPPKAGVKAPGVISFPQKGKNGLKMASYPHFRQ